jgi:hypothetical protein
MIFASEIAAQADSPEAGRVKVVFRNAYRWDKTCLIPYGRVLDAGMAMHATIIGNISPAPSR